MKLLRMCLMFSVMCLFFQGVSAQEKVEPLAPVTDKDRCAVCGMFVAKYPSWITQIQLTDSRVVMFDGPKDMFVYYFSPEMYGAEAATPEHLRVKDYYTGKWLSGLDALYVTGSDVFGPMGYELVPFDSAEAAENFLKDHHGKTILTFDQVTGDLVRSMRKGHKMKLQMKK